MKPLIFGSRIRGFANQRLVARMDCPLIVPVESAEILSDTSLEANYTAGLCDTLTKNGAPTVAQSGDVHSGSKAQQFTATAQSDYLRSGTKTQVAGEWKHFSVWAKRTVGTAGKTAMKLWDLSDGVAPYRFITAAQWSQYHVCKFATGTAGWRGVLCADDSTGPFDSVIVDDHSMKTITDPTSALLDITIKQGRYRFAPYVQAGSQAGWRICCNAAKTYFLTCYIDRNFDYLCFDKVEAGVRTSLTYGTVLYHPSKDIEIIIDGTTITLRYDDAVVGAPQTVDTSSNYGTYVCGMSTLEGNDPGTIKAYIR